MIAQRWQQRARGYCALRDELLDGEQLNLAAGFAPSRVGVGDNGIGSAEIDAD